MAIADASGFVLSATWDFISQVPPLDRPPPLMAPTSTSVSSPPHCPQWYTIAPISIGAGPMSNGILFAVHEKIFYLSLG